MKYTLEEDILKLIEYALENKAKNNKFVDFSITTNEVKELKKITGLDYSDYVHSLDISGIIHALKHNNIKSSDFLLIPFIVKNYDLIGEGVKENTIVYKKLLGKEYFYIEEVRKGRKKLTIKTFYKRKIKTPSEA